MKSKLKVSIGTAVGAVGLAATMATTTVAREPGVFPTIPSGATIGVPIAAQPPTGVFFSSRTGFSNQDFYDDNGNETVTDIQIRDTLFQFVFVPGIEMFGAQYRAFLSVPYIHADVDDIVTPSGLVDSGRSLLGNVEIRPLDLSWQVAPDVFVNAGASIYTPGDFDDGRILNPVGNFWTVSPSVGVTYLRDGWNATAHLLYFTNTKNRDNDYDSGDEVHLNLTAMKEISDGFSVGPVAYWRQQVTDDKNPGGAYGGQLGGLAESMGLGLAVTKQFGPVNVNFMYTKDVNTRNSGGGDRFWINAGIPLYVPNPPTP